MWIIDYLLFIHLKEHTSIQMCQYLHPKVAIQPNCTDRKMFQQKSNKSLKNIAGSDNSFDFGTNCAHWQLWEGTRFHDRLGTNGTVPTS